jgi:hypothetical protein
MPTVIALHIWSPDTEFPTPVDTIELTWGGVPGDRHYGEHMQSNSRESHAFPRGTTIRNYRQVSIVDQAELDQIAQRMGVDEIIPGTIGDNICTEGLVELTATPLMTRLMFPSGASIMTGGENNPCTIAGGMVQARYGTLPHKFPKAAMHLRGITGWVERPGLIQVGDPIQVVGLH